MASLILAWRGNLADRAIQDELLNYIERFAALSAEFLAPEPKVPRFSEILAAQRGRGLHERPNIELVDKTITGRIVVRSDVSTDHEIFSEASRQAGLEPSFGATSHLSCDRTANRLGASSNTFVCSLEAKMVSRPPCSQLSRSRLFNKYRSSGEN